MKTENFFKVLSSINHEEPKADPADPYVPPKDQMPFDKEVENRIHFFKDQIISADSFEQFLDAIHTVAFDLNLNLAQDLYDLAGYMNQVRMKAGKKPM